MKSPRDEYRFLKDVRNIKDEAYYELYEKYIIENRRGGDKLTQVGSTDQETLLLTRNGGFPIPGMVYTFIYGEPDQIFLKPGQNNQPEDLSKRFIDLIPLVFCMNIDTNRFKGINFNMLPSNVRLDFLDEYYHVFEDFMEREASLLSEHDKIAINRRFLEYVKSGRGQNMIKLFNRSMGANFNYAYRSYLVNKVSRLRMIEYNEWVYIPFLEPKNAFRRLSHRQIHDLYHRTK